MIDEPIHLRECAAIAIENRDGYVRTASRRVHGVMTYVLTEAHGQRARRSGAAEHAMRAFLDSLERGRAARLEDWLVRGFSEANEAVYEEPLPPHSAALAYSTSMLVALLDADTLVIGHLGSGRACSYDSTLVSLVKPHVAAHARSNALSGVAGHNRHFPTRALGTSDTATPDLVARDVRPNELVVMASSGLHELLDEPGIGLLFASHEPAQEISNAYKQHCIERAMVGAAMFFRAPNVTDDP